MTPLLSRNKIKELRGYKMFDMKKETVEIKKKDGSVDVYEISPLPGKYLSDLYAVMDAFQGAKTEETEVLKILSTEASQRLHKIVFASLEASYPDIDKKTLDSFVSRNLLKFMEAVIKVNMPEE